MGDQNGNAVDTIYMFLGMDELSEEDEKFISLYMDAYNMTLNEYINTDNPSDELTHRLRTLSGPIMFASRKVNDNVSTPALEIIKGKLKEYSDGLEHDFARSRFRKPDSSKANAAIARINGFATATVVIGITIILGIILSVLLYFIK